MRFLNSARCIGVNVTELLAQQLVRVLGPSVGDFALRLRLLRISDM